MRVYSVQASSEEAAATIAARTSRSPKTFREIAAEVEEQGHAPFLKKNVLGYGHDSVAEGAITPWIAIEDCSDLAACVITTADPQLKVQMTSTRYQSMDARNVLHDSGDDKAVAEIMDLLKHHQGLAITAADNSDHPRKLTLARDISRGWMPAGIKSQLAIRHDARGMRDTICFLIGHELAEVRAIGGLILSATKDTIGTLLDRHINSAPKPEVVEHDLPEVEMGQAWFGGQGLDEANADPWLHAELRAWVESGYRRRHRINACPHGPYLAGGICSDWGAYRDLRRNRTIHQTDILPNPQVRVDDPLWAFRESHPDVADQLEGLEWIDHVYKDPYLALMNTPVFWYAGGHALNWAYALRLRSKMPGCHPAYALPMRALMLQIRDDAPALAEAMGLVRDKSALGGVEFSDLRS